jgi:hypothetical protein
MSVRYVMAIVIVMLFFCLPGAFAADPPKQAEQVKQLVQAEAEAAVVKAYLQQQLSAIEERLVRIRDARQRAEEAAKKEVKPKEKQ